MSDKPTRKVQDAGRERLLEAARALFRAQVRHEVSRKDIARKAGVAPGLMTYHFRSNVDLVLAATSPVLTAAIRSLVKVLDNTETCEERFRQCIGLFLDFAETNASILDIYVQTAVESGDPEAQALIGATLERLGRFFAETVEAGLVARDTNPQFLLLALWGMCRLVGGTRPYPLAIHNAAEEQPGESRQTQIDLIYRLVLHGTGMLRPTSTRADAAENTKPAARSPRRREPKTPRS